MSDVIDRVASVAGSEPPFAGGAAGSINYSNRVAGLQECHRGPNAREGRRSNKFCPVCNLSAPAREVHTSKHSKIGHLVRFCRG
jgi:hypothetical protein